MSNKPSITLIDLHFAGSCSYYAALIGSERLVFEVKTHYQKAKMFNRTRVMGPNGISKLSIPIIYQSGRISFDDVCIAYDEDWQRVHWNTLVSNYRRSPYFEFYEDELCAVYMQQKEKLVDYSLQMNAWILKVLDLNIPVELSTTYSENHSEYRDLRNAGAPILSIEEAGQLEEYSQVFQDRLPFCPDLSVLDLLFNLGPSAKQYLIDIRTDD